MTNREHLIALFAENIIEMAEALVSDDNEGHYYSHIGTNYSVEEAIIEEIKWLESEYVEPLTWNERINQMTVEEKARLLVVESSVIRNIGNGEKEYPVWITPLISGVAFTSEEAAINFNKNKLASQYTEGEKHEG